MKDQREPPQNYGMVPSAPRLVVAMLGMIAGWSGALSAVLLAVDHAAAYVLLLLAALVAVALGVISGPDQPAPHP